MVLFKRSQLNSRILWGAMMDTRTFIWGLSLNKFSFLFLVIDLLTSKYFLQLHFHQRWWWPWPDEKREKQKPIKSTHVFLIVSSKIQLCKNMAHLWNLRIHVTIHLIRVIENTRAFLGTHNYTILFEMFAVYSCVTFGKKTKHKNQKQSCKE